MRDRSRAICRPKSRSGRNSQEFMMSTVLAIIAAIIVLAIVVILILARASRSLKAIAETCRRHNPWRRSVCHRISFRPGGCLPPERWIEQLTASIGSHACRRPRHRHRARVRCAAHADVQAVHRPLPSGALLGPARCHQSGLRDGRAAGREVGAGDALPRRQRVAGQRASILRWSSQSASSIATCRTTTVAGPTACRRRNSSPPFCSRKSTAGRSSSPMSARSPSLTVTRQCAEVSPTSSSQGYERIDAYLLTLSDNGRGR